MRISNHRERDRFKPVSFDPFQRGWAQYAFENRCMEDHSLALGDGTKKVFFNTTAYQKADDKDIQALLQYMNGGKPTSDFTEVLDNKIRLAKSNDEWRLEFMKFEVMQMDARAKGREEGILGTITALQELELSSTDIIEKLRKIYSLTTEQAQAYLKLAAAE